MQNWKLKLACVIFTLYYCMSILPIGLLFGAILASLSLPMVKALMTEKNAHRENKHSKQLSVMYRAAKRFQKGEEVDDHISAWHVAILQNRSLHCWRDFVRECFCFGGEHEWRGRKEIGEESS